MGTAIQVTGTETLEEIYFLIRTGTWHQEHVASYITLKEDTAYNHGVDDATQDGYHNAQGEADDAYNRGYDAGHNEGYKEGYGDGVRESSYDINSDRDRW